MPGICIDLSFPLEGDRIPIDHGYGLYAAVSRIAPALHEAPWLGIHPINGKPIGDGLMRLDASAHLRLRLPPERVGETMPLIGALLDLRGVPLHVLAPRIDRLEPAASLDARTVAIKLTDAPKRHSATVNREALDVAAIAERFAKEVKRQLAALCIERPFDLCGRRQVTVDGRRLIGYSVRVRELEADESLRLQESGIGGKRRMGCGIFRPTRGRIFGDHA